MYFIWVRAGDIKYQEIALWGLCLVISAVIESAHREFFVLSSWTHPAHLRRVSDSNTVSSCKHEMGTEIKSALCSWAGFVRSLMEQQISTHPLKCGWAVLLLPKLVHFPAHWQFTFFFVVLLHRKWSCFSFFLWKGDFFFCLRTCFRFWKTKKSGKMLQKNKRCLVLYNSIVQLLQGCSYFFMLRQN